MKTRRSTEEADFQQGILDVADLYGWLSYHTFDSRRSRAGFPDLVLVRNGKMIIAELKSTKGKTTAEQAKWIEALRGVDGDFEVYVWRPSDMDLIIELLKW